MHPAVHPRESTAAVVVDIAADHGMAGADLSRYQVTERDRYARRAGTDSSWALFPAQDAGRIGHVRVPGCGTELRRPILRGSLVAAEPLSAEVVRDDPGGGEVAVDGPGGREQAR